jgi:hypothetical protein
LHFTKEVIKAQVPPGSELIVLGKLLEHGIPHLSAGFFPPFLGA